MRIILKFLANERNILSGSFLRRGIMCTSMNQKQSEAPFCTLANIPLKLFNFYCFKPFYAFSNDFENFYPFHFFPRYSVSRYWLLRYCLVTAHVLKTKQNLVNSRATCTAIVLLSNLLFSDVPVTVAVVVILGSFSNDDGDGADDAL